MTLASGDLTTPARVGVWLANGPPANSPVISQLITSMTSMIYSKLNRARTFSQTFTRTFDGVGNMQLVLPDWPVTAVAQVQQGNNVVPPSALPDPTTLIQPPNTTQGYGYRWVKWGGNLPGEAVVLEFVGGYLWTYPQNVKVTYTAGYLIQNEPWTVPVSPFQVTVSQPMGIWCRDNGVTYANGTPLTPVTAITAAGQYMPPVDATPGLYTFGIADQGQQVLISYSFVPADLEEACIQMVAERYAYRSRVGEISKSLGGQETIRWARGYSGPPWNNVSSLPPEVMELIWPYVSVIPPAIGAPV